MVSASQVFCVLVQLSSSTGADLGRLRGHIPKINGYLSNKHPSIFERKNEQGKKKRRGGR